MSDEIVVPEGMLDAATHGATAFDGRVSFPPYIKAALEAALRWLSENPIAPSEQQTDVGAVEFDESKGVYGSYACWWAAEWQRRMFRAPEPEVPEAIKDLMAKWGNRFDEAILEAYRLGQKAAANSNR